ncbi:MAG: hypothetical protein LKKZDAJK_000469 [Candidatus Fervidibacter sp.]
MGNQNLSTISCLTNLPGSAHRDSVIVGSALRVNNDEGFACVHSHSHLKFSNLFTPILLGDGLLKGDGTLYRFFSVGEGNQKTVTEVLDLKAMKTLKALTKKGIVGFKNPSPTLLEPLLQHCRAFYVGEHQGHRPCRQPLPCHLLSPPFNRTPLMPMRLHFIPPPLAFPLGVEGWRSFPRFRPQGAEDFPPPLAHRQDGASWRWIPSAQPLL